MSEDEKIQLHKEIKKNRWNNWLFQGCILAIIAIAFGHFWDAGAQYMKDRPITEKREEEKKKLMSMVIVKLDSLLYSQVDHAHADHIRDSVEDARWIADDISKEKINKKVDDMTNVFVETLNTVSSIQNRISKKNYLLDCDE